MFSSNEYITLSILKICQSHCEDAFKNRNYNRGRNKKVIREQKKYKKETSDVLKLPESEFQISD